MDAHLDLKEQLGALREVTGCPPKLGTALGAQLTPWVQGIPLLHPQALELGAGTPAQQAVSPKSALSPLTARQMLSLSI